MNSNIGKYGSLLTPDVTSLYRNYFNEMVNLIGIKIFYRAPKPGKTYTNYTEIISNYYDPIEVGCIFEEHPEQQTLKKLGWVSELQENISVIHIPYDTPEIQQGALFYLPSGLDEGKSRLFRVIKISNIMIYPSSISCQIVPEYENTFQPEQYNYNNSSFNVLQEEESDKPEPFVNKLLNEEEDNL